MGDSYTIYFLNRTNDTGTVCLYQRDDRMSNNVMPLAWFTQSTPPQYLHRFDWRTDKYEFFWAETGVLTPGVVVYPRDVEFANEIYANSITLSGSAPGNLRFGNWGSGAGFQSFDINSAASIPPDTASVGMTMSGAPAYVVQAQPGTRNTFAMADRYSTSYWLTFGDYQAGQVLDVSKIPFAEEIRFFGRSNAVDVELIPGHRFSVRPRDW